MDEYYSVSPRWALARPIVLAGPVGSGLRGVAHGLSARTGLPFVDVDRRVEHETGASLGDLARRVGVMRIQTAAREVLERVALERPAAVVVLDRAWPARQAAHLFDRRMELVHVRRAETLIDPKRRQDLTEAAWLSDPGLEIRATDDVRPAWETMRDPLLQRARILLEAEERHAHQIVEILMESLEPVVGAKAL
jgi:shikimate kinase